MNYNKYVTYIDNHTNEDIGLQYPYLDMELGSRSGDEEGLLNAHV